jgi:hypothetical protein
MTSKPRSRARWIVAAVVTATVVVPLVALGISLYDAAQDRWAWRLADLDRNRLHLSPRPEAVEGGTVVEESRSELVVEYAVEITDWMGQPTGEFMTVCYRFPFQDVDDFREVPCS